MANLDCSSAMKRFLFEDLYRTDYSDITRSKEQYFSTRTKRKVRNKIRTFLKNSFHNHAVIGFEKFRETFDESIIQSCYKDEEIPLPDLK